MRIVTIQRRLRERGRIRLGYSTPGSRAGIKRPHKLDRFRFSAPDVETCEQVAALFGGKVEPWPEGGRDQYHVTTDAKSLRVIFPSQMSFSQAYEQYAKGFPVVRCDGETCWAPGPNRRLDERPCACNPDERDCKMTTNLNVILPEIPGLGVWRLVTHSYYAGVELATIVDLIEMAMQAGARVPARLFLEHREVRRLVDGKPEVKKFIVPVLDLDMSAGALGPSHAGATMLGGTGVPALDMPAEAPEPIGWRPPEPAGWRPVDQAALPPGPTITVEDQLAEVEREPKRRRANATPEIQPTGRRPRPSTNGDAGTCDLCGEEYGAAAVVRNPEPGGSKYVHKQCRDNAAADDESPASQEAPGRGGTSGDDGPSARAAVAEPTPAAQADPPMTHGMHKKVMALQAEAFPSWDGATGAEVDDYRRRQLLRLCELLGQPGLTSRADIGRSTATQLIDALEKIAAGDLVLKDGGPLVRADTGEVVLS